MAIIKKVIDIKKVVKSKKIIIGVFISFMLVNLLSYRKWMWFLQPPRLTKKLMVTDNCPKYGLKCDFSTTSTANNNSDHFLQKSVNVNEHNYKDFQDFIRLMTDHGQTGVKTKPANFSIFIQKNQKKRMYVYNSNACYSNRHKNWIEVDTSIFMKMLKQELENNVTTLYAC